MIRFKGILVVRLFSWLWSIYKSKYLSKFHFSHTILVRLYYRQPTHWNKFTQYNFLAYYIFSICVLEPGWGYGWGWMRLSPSNITCLSKVDTSSFFWLGCIMYIVVQVCNPMVHKLLHSKFMTVLSMTNVCHACMVLNH